jgi:hypothetical protein
MSARAITSPLQMPDIRLQAHPTCHDYGSVPLLAGEVHIGGLGHTGFRNDTQSCIEDFPVFRIREYRYQTLGLAIAACVGLGLAGCRRDVGFDRIGASSFPRLAILLQEERLGLR